MKNIEEKIKEKVIGTDEEKITISRKRYRYTILGVGLLMFAIGRFSVLFG